MPSVQVIKESKRKKDIVCLGIFMHYFLCCGISLALFVQLCARECLWSPVSESPDAVGWQISVHDHGTSCCSLPLVCSCIFFHFLPTSPPTCWCSLFVLGHDKCRTGLLLAVAKFLVTEKLVLSFLPECRWSVEEDMVWGEAYTVLAHHACSVWRRGLQSEWMSIWHILLAVASSIHFLCCTVKHASAVVAVM